MHLYRLARLIDLEASYQNALDAVDRFNSKHYGNRAVVAYPGRTEYAVLYTR